LADHAFRLHFSDIVVNKTLAITRAVTLQGNSTGEPFKFIGSLDREDGYVSTHAFLWCAEAVLKARTLPPKAFKKLFSHWSGGWLSSI
jgi:hypothetical protein